MSDGITRTITLRANVNDLVKDISAAATGFSDMNEEAKAALKTIKDLSKANLKKLNGDVFKDIFDASDDAEKFQKKVIETANMMQALSNKLNKDAQKELGNLNAKQTREILKASLKNHTKKALSDMVIRRADKNKATLGEEKVSGQFDKFVVSKKEAQQRFASLTMNKVFEGDNIDQIKQYIAYFERLKDLKYMFKPGQKATIDKRIASLIDGNGMVKGVFSYDAFVNKLHEAFDKYMSPEEKQKKDNYAQILEKRKADLKGLLELYQKYQDALKEYQKTSKSLEKLGDKATSSDKGAFEETKNNLQEAKSKLDPYANYSKVIATSKTGTQYSFGLDKDNINLQQLQDMFMNIGNFKNIKFITKDMDKAMTASVEIGKILKNQGSVFDLKSADEQLAKIKELEEHIENIRNLNASDTDKQIAGILDTKSLEQAESIIAKMKTGLSDTAYKEFSNRTSGLFANLNEEQIGKVASNYEQIVVNLKSGVLTVEEAVSKANGLVANFANEKNLEKEKKILSDILKLYDKRTEIQDDINSGNYDDESGEKKLEGRLKTVDDKIEEIEQEYYRAIVKMKDGTQYELPFEYFGNQDEDAEEAEKQIRSILKSKEQMAQVQDIQIITPEMEARIDSAKSAYDDLIDDVKRFGKNGKLTSTSDWDFDNDLGSNESLLKSFENSIKEIKAASADGLIEIDEAEIEKANNLMKQLKSNVEILQREGDFIESDISQKLGLLPSEDFSKIEKDYNSILESVKNGTLPLNEALEKTKALLDSIGGEKKIIPGLEKELSKKEKAVSDFSEELGYFSKRLSEDSYKTSGKKDATTQLKNAFKELQQYNIDPDKYKNERFAKQAREIDLYRSWKEAQKQGVAKNTLDKYRPAFINEDGSVDSGFDKSIKTFNKEFNNRVKWISRIEERINELKNEISEIENSTKKNESKAKDNIGESEQIESEANAHRDNANAIKEEVAAKADLEQINNDIAEINRKMSDHLDSDLGSSFEYMISNMETYKSGINNIDTSGIDATIESIKALEEANHELVDEQLGSQFEYMIDNSEFLESTKAKQSRKDADKAVLNAMEQANKDAIKQREALIKQREKYDSELGSQYEFMINNSDFLESIKVKKSKKDADKSALDALQQANKESIKEYINEKNKRETEIGKQYLSMIKSLETYESKIPDSLNADADKLSLDALYQANNDTILDIQREEQEKLEKERLAAEERIKKDRVEKAQQTAKELSSAFQKLDKGSLDYQKLKNKKESGEEMSPEELLRMKEYESLLTNTEAIAFEFADAVNSNSNALNEEKEALASVNLEREKYNESASKATNAIKESKNISDNIRVQKEEEAADKNRVANNKKTAKEIIGQYSSLEKDLPKYMRLKSQKESGELISGKDLQFIEDYEKRMTKASLDSKIFEDRILSTTSALEGEVDAVEDVNKAVSSYGQKTKAVEKQQRIDDANKTAKDIEKEFANLAKDVDKYNAIKAKQDRGEVLGAKEAKFIKEYEDALELANIKAEVFIDNISKMSDALKEENDAVARAKKSIEKYEDELTVSGKSEEEKRLALEKKKKDNELEEKKRQQRKLAEKATKSFNKAYNLEEDYKRAIGIDPEQRTKSQNKTIADYTKAVEEAINIQKQLSSEGFDKAEQSWVDLTNAAKKYSEQAQKAVNENTKDIEQELSRIGSDGSGGYAFRDDIEGFEEFNSQRLKAFSLIEEIKNGTKYINDNGGFDNPNNIQYIETIRKKSAELNDTFIKIKKNSGNFIDTKNIAGYESRINSVKEKLDNLLKNKNLTGNQKTIFSQMRKELDDGVVENRLNEMNTAIDNFQNKMSGASNDGITFMDRFKNRLQSLTTYLATFISFYEVVNVVKQMASSVKEFDTALTEMRKVSNESVDTLKAYQDQSFDMAKSIGTDALSLQNSTADFMRLGQTLEEAKDSAMSANVLMNVSEFESIDQATDSLIAMKSAYKDLSNMEIIDKLNEVGNNMPIATAGLATALQDSASALTTANNSIDESIALITAGNAITQDPTKTGKGIRTIALRLTGTEEAKTELEEIGEDTENVITTQSKLRSTVMEATKVASNGFKGFDILNPNGSYKSTYEIMLGIADVWKEIKETDAKYGTKRSNLLLESIAGKNRANIAASILESPDLLRDALEYSAGANGSAMRENEKYLDSITGKLNQLKTAYQELSATAIDSNFLKVLTDMGTVGLEGLTKYVDLFGTLGSVLPIITGGIGMLGGGVFNMDKNGNISKPIFDAFKKSQVMSLTELDNNFIDEVINKGLVGATADFDLMEGSIEGVNNQLIKFAKNSETIEGFRNQIDLATGATTKATQIFKSLGASLLNIGINFAVGLAISGIANLVMKAYDDIAHAREHIQEAMDDAQSSIEDANSSFESQSSSIENVKKRYAELAEGVKVTSSEIKNMSLSDEEFSEFLNLNRQLSDIAPDLVSGYDTQGNALIKLGDGYTEVTNNIDEYIEKLREARNLEVSGNMKDLFAGVKANVSDLEKQSDEILEIKNNIENAAKTGFVFNNEDYEYYRDILKQLGISEEDQVYYFSGQTSSIQVKETAASILESGEAVSNAIAVVNARYGKDYKNLIEGTNALKEQQQKEWQSVSEEMLQSIQAGEVYQNLKLKGQDAINAFQGVFNNLDFGAIINNNGLEKWSDFQGWVENNLIIPISTMYPQINNALDMREAFDNNKVTAQEYINTLSDLFESDLFNKLPKEVQDALHSAFTYTSEDGRNIDQMMRNISDKMNAGIPDVFRDNKSLFDYLGNLSKEDLELALEIVQPGMTIDELQSKIEETKEQAAEGIDLEARTNLEDYNKAKEEKSYLSDYESYRSMMEEAKQLRSENKIGSKVFESAAKAFSVNGMTDVTNWDENVATLGKYFTEDARDGLQLFLEDLETAKYAAQDADGSWQLTFDDMEQAANDLYMPFEMLTVLLSGLKEYGFANDFFANAEDGADVIANLSEELATEKARLTELQEQEEQGTLVDENGNVIQAQIDKVEELEGRLASAKKALEEFVKATREDMEKNRESAKELAEAYAEDFAKLDKYNDDGSKNESYDYLVSEYIGRMQEIAAKYKIEIPLDFQLGNPDVETKLTENGQIQVDVVVNGKEDLEAAQEVYESTPEEQRKNLVFNFDVQNKDLLDETERQRDELISGDNEVTVNVNANTEAAMQDMRQAAEEIDKVDGKTANMNVNINANNNALSEMEKTSKYAETYGGTVTQTQNVNEVHTTTFTETGADNVINKANEVSSASDNTDKDHTATFAETGADNVIDKATEASSAANKVGGTRTAIFKAIDYATSTANNVASTLNNLDGKTAHTYIYTHKETVGSSGGGAGATGTTGFVSSYAIGTVLSGMKAYFGGHNIALSEDQKALVGEEGVEGLVRDGRFYLIGENSPEIRDLKKGDIIFSAKQTKAILNGQKTSRGKTIGMPSHADGTANVLSKGYITAFADGLMNAYAGTGTSRGPSLGSSNSSTSSTNNSSTQSTKTVQENTKATKDNTKENKKSNKTQKKTNDSLEALQKKWDALEDWIDDWIAAWDRTYDELQTYANDIHQNYTAQNAYIEKTYSHIDDINKNYSSMYKKYMSQANASGLPDAYKKKVQGNTIDIQSIKDEKLKAQIEEYKRWYDLAQSVRTKIIELRAEQSKLAEQKLTNIQDDYEKLSDIYSNTIDYYKQAISLKRTLGKTYKSAIDTNGTAEMNGFNYYRGAAETALGKTAYGVNLSSLYGSALDAQRQTYNAHLNEYNKLTKEFNSLVKRGKIKKNDDVWRTWQATLRELHTTILADREAFMQLREELMDYHWEGFNKNIETIEYTLKELDDIIGHINENNLFSKEGVITNDGLSYIGTIGIALGEAKQELVNYQSAIKTLEKQYKNGNISQETYTEKLREYLDAIREASNSVDDYKDKLLDLYKSQMQAENEALKENISLRQESLKRLREYDSYAKTIKTKNKDINSLQAQIASLNGTTTQEGKAELARLRAQLQEAQEDLSDTQQEHRWDMMEQGYSDMADKADKKFDEVTENIERNTKLQESIIKKMLDTVLGSYDSTFKEINKTVTNAGIVLSNKTENDIKSLSNESTAEKLINKAEGTVSYNNEDNVSKGTVKADDVTKNVKTSIELTSLTMDKTKASIYVGSTVKLTATKTPVVAQGKITWASSNAKIATVNNGTVKGVAAGSVTITATCAGKTAKCVVTVKKKEKTVVKTTTKTTSPQKSTPVKTPQKNTTATNISKDGLAVRQSPGNKQKLLTAIPSGKRATLVLDGSGNYQTKKADNMVWMKVKYGSKTGWAKQKYLKYAKGAKRINKDQIGITQDDGSEIIVSNGRMLVPTQLYKGDTVYPNDITEKLWDMGKLGTEGIKEKIERDLQIKVPAGLNGIKENTENNFGDYNVTINALQKLDRKEVQQLSEYFYNDWYKRMKKDLVASGIKR